MLAQLLIAGLLLQAAPYAPTAKPSTSQTAASGVKDTDTDPAALLKVKRIYVETFGDDVISRELQSMIVSSLVATKRFKVTENRERADAILKGVALEKTAQELHAYSEGTVAGSGAISDSSAHTETTSDAKLSIRLVNSDGDVIWTSTQESKGAKYKGSSADVADKCVKQLLRDVEKLERTGAPQLTAAPTSAGAQHN
jgi:curli biogenesis system outer membrane secretion channel CsgG